MIKVSRITPDDGTKGFWVDPDGELCWGITQRTQDKAGVFMTEGNGPLVFVPNGETIYHSAREALEAEKALLADEYRSRVERIDQQLREAIGPRGVLLDEGRLFFVPADTADNRSRWGRMDPETDIRP